MVYAYPREKQLSSQKFYRGVVGLYINFYAESSSLKYDGYMYIISVLSIFSIISELNKEFPAI